MAKPKSIMIPLYLLEDWKELDDSQLGRLIRAGMQFALDGTVAELEPPERYFFMNFRREIEKDAIRYAEKCEKNRQNITRYWNSIKDSDTTEYDRKESNTTVNDGERMKTMATNNHHQYQYPKPLPYQSSSSTSSLDGLTGELMEDGYEEEEIRTVLSQIPPDTEIRNARAYVKRCLDNARVSKDLLNQPGMRKTGNRFMDAIRGEKNDDKGNC